MVPIVVLLGVYSLGVSLLPGIKPALTAVPALAAAVSRHAWYPLVVGGIAVIVSYALTADDGQSFQDVRATTRASAIAVVSVLGSLAVIIRERQERVLRQTRMVADAVQRVLARPIPDRIGPMRAAVHYSAAHAYAKIGGDLYEVLQTRYGVRAVVGDVQGKGLDAVETAAAMLGAFREAAHEEPAFDQLARRLADPLDRMPGRNGEAFVTAVLMGVGSEAIAEVVNCGHPSPLLLRNTETPRGLDPPERVPPLGVLPPDQVRPPVLSVPLRPGDRILLYTDGVIEARDPAGNFYPLAERLRWQVRDEPREILRRLNRDVLRHVGRRLDDDAAMVLLEYAPHGAVQKSGRGLVLPGPRTRMAGALPIQPGLPSGHQMSGLFAVYVRDKRPGHEHESSAGRPPGRVSVHERVDAWEATPAAGSARRPIACSRAASRARPRPARRTTGRRRSACLSRSGPGSRRAGNASCTDHGRW
jgi:serine phosphatase RsbU (regulator of sigma subunit)